ncbi:MAG: hypothetical protein QGG54_21605, partial [Gammaproteobacteria bacterium]|nr:hypothetical protein [Gammaproteobacteria bacterium]
MSLLLSAGLVLTALPESADAQLPLYTCRPNAAGDGWICDSTDPAASGNTADGINRYNSDNAVLPRAPQADVQQPTVAPEIQDEVEATAVDADVVTTQDQLPLQ